MEQSMVEIKQDGTIRGARYSPDFKRKSYLCSDCGNWFRMGGWRHTDQEIHCGQCHSINIEKIDLTKEQAMELRDKRLEDAKKNSEPVASVKAISSKIRNVK